MLREARRLAVRERVYSQKSASDIVSRFGLKSFCAQCPSAAAHIACGLKIICEALSLPEDGIGSAWRADNRNWILSIESYSKPASRNAEYHLGRITLHSGQIPSLLHEYGHHVDICHGISRSTHWREALRSSDYLAWQRHLDERDGIVRDTVGQSYRTSPNEAWARLFDAIVFRRRNSDWPAAGPRSREMALHHVNELAPVFDKLIGRLQKP